MANKKFCRKLVDSVYQRDIYLIIGTHDEAGEYLKKRFKVEDDNLPDDDTLGHADELPTGEYIIWLSGYDVTPEWNATVAHECFHTVKSVFAYIGISLTDESEEAYAYYLDSLVRQVHELSIKYIE